MTELATSGVSKAEPCSLVFHGLQTHRTNESQAGSVAVYAPMHGLWNHREHLPSESGVLVETRQHVYRIQRDTGGQETCPRGGHCSMCSVPRHPNQTNSSAPRESSRVRCVHRDILFTSYSGTRLLSESLLPLYEVDRNHTSFAGCTRPGNHHGGRVSQGIRQGIRQQRQRYNPGAQTCDESTPRTSPASGRGSSSQERQPTRQSASQFGTVGSFTTIGSTSCRSCGMGQRNIEHVRERGGQT